MSHNASPAPGGDRPETFLWTIAGGFRQVFTGLFVTGPHRGAHTVAIRAGISVGVPLVILWACGRLDLGIYAGFGAFASLYGRFDSYRVRIRMQLVVGMMLVGSMLVGTLLSLVAAPPTIRVAIIALIASGVSIMAYIYRWHPPGSLFTVFASGACAVLPAIGLSVVHVLVVGGATVLFSVAVTMASRLVGSRLHMSAAEDDAHPAQKLDRTGVIVAFTAGLGALLAGLVGTALGETRWYWAVVAAIAALGGTKTTARLIRGAQRFLGTAVGLAVAAFLFSLNLGPIPTILAIVVFQAGAELLVNRNYGLAMLCITPLALLMVDLASSVNHQELLRDRLVDTAVGVAIGTSIAIVSALMRRRSFGINDAQ